MGFPLSGTRKGATPSPGPRTTAALLPLHTAGRLNSTEGWMNAIWALRHHPEALFGFGEIHNCVPSHAATIEFRRPHRDGSAARVYDQSAAQPVGLGRGILRSWQSGYTGAQAKTGW